MAGTILAGVVPFGYTIEEGILPFDPENKTKKNLQLVECAVFTTHQNGLVLDFDDYC